MFIKAAVLEKVSWKLSPVNICCLWEMLWTIFLCNTQNKASEVCKTCINDTSLSDLHIPPGNISGLTI